MYETKHTRFHLPLCSIKTNGCFELLHVDVWRKYRTPSLSGANYFLTIVGDFSKAVWVYLLKHKIEACNYLIDFQNIVKTQFEKRIKRIRDDIGGKFISWTMKDFTRKKELF